LPLVQEEKILRRPITRRSGKSQGRGGVLTQTKGGNGREKNNEKLTREKSVLVNQRNADHICMSQLAEDGGVSKIPGWRDIERKKQKKGGGEKRREKR